MLRQQLDQRIHQRLLENAPGHQSARQRWNRRDGRGTDLSAHRQNSTKSVVTLWDYWPPNITRCSTIGPSASAGKNVSAPMMMTTPISIATNKGVWVGNVPRLTGTFF